MWDLEHRSTVRLHGVQTAAHSQKYDDHDR